jgi:hypothetical protein
MGSGMKKTINQIDIPTSIAVGYAVPLDSFPRHKVKSWLNALLWSIRLLKAFDAGGSEAAIALLHTVPCSRSYMRSYPKELQIYKAQGDATRLRSLFHLMLDARACFSESLALCAGLRCLGWDCTVVEGYASVQVFASTKMHAWVVYQGVPVSDLLDVYYGYIPVQHYGSSEE